MLYHTESIRFSVPSVQAGELYGIWGVLTTLYGFLFGWVIDWLGTVLSALVHSSMKTPSKQGHKFGTNRGALISLLLDQHQPGLPSAVIVCVLQVSSILLLYVELWAFVDGKQHASLCSGYLRSANASMQLVDALLAYSCCATGFMHNGQVALTVVHFVAPLDSGCSCHWQDHAPYFYGPCSCPPLLQEHSAFLSSLLVSNT